MDSPGLAFQQRNCFYPMVHQIRHGLIFVHKLDPSLLLPVSTVSVSSPLDTQTRNLGFILYYSIALQLNLPSKNLHPIKLQGWLLLPTRFQFSLLAWITQKVSPQLVCMPLALFPPSSPSSIQETIPQRSL